MAQVATGGWRVAGSKRAGLLDCLHLVQIAESRLQLFGRLSSRQDSSLLNIASLRRVALRAYYLLLTDLPQVLNDSGLLQRYPQVVSSRE